MKYLVYIFSSLNLYLGIRFLLNAIGVLQISKYAPVANVFFAITLTTSAGLAFYFSISAARNSLGLLVDAVPWIITLILVAGSLLFSDYKWNLFSLR